MNNIKDDMNVIIKTILAIYSTWSEPLKLDTEIVI